jgi:hypothetical protein
MQPRVLPHRQTEEELLKEVKIENIFKEEEDPKGRRKPS